MTVAAQERRARVRLPAFEESSGLLIALLLVVFMEVTSVMLGIDPLQVLVTGLAFGALYGVVALGYTMVYGIIELINFAHGDVFAVGAFVSLVIMEHVDSQMAAFGGSLTEGQHTLHFLGTTMHVDLFWMIILVLFINIVVAAVVCAVLGVVIERVAYRPLRNAPRLAPLITAIGISFIIENILFQWRGGLVLAYPQVMPLRSFSNIGPIKLSTAITNIELFVIGSGLVLMLLLDAFVNRTTLGKAMRAVAQDREAALMMGINVNRIISVTFLVGSALAGAGAVIYGVDLTSIGNTMGFSLGLFAFTAAVLGGIGNIRGAMLGGLLIGIIKRYVSALGQGSGTEWADAAVFAVLIIVLVFRPAGLLGQQVPEKV